MKTKSKTRLTREAGMVLAMVLILAVIVSVVVGSMLATAHSAVRMTKKWREQDETFLIAQSALEKAKWDIQTAFREYFEASPLPRTGLKFPWFDTYTETSIGSTSRYNAPQGDSYEGGQVWVEIDNVTDEGYGKRSLLLKVRATHGGTEREVMEQVHYELAPSPVFDYAYFINNFGWFWGGPIYAHGEVRSNGNFSFRYGPKVNGDALAAYNPALGAAGRVDGSWNNWSLSYYRSHAPSQARPTNPPAVGYDGLWPMGYGGDPARYQRLHELEMPYLGDLSDYAYLASLKNGKIRQGSTTLVNGVYNGPGPDGVSGTPDDGTLVLEGTTAHPIEIDGPVVIPGDVILKGMITGQGTVYAGRNVYIVNNVTYKNPATWPHPDTHPKTTLQQNQTKDFVGLAAKGNILLGDYHSSSWQYYENYFLRPHFTQPYDTDPSDDAIGYDSDHNPSNGHRFNGDYFGLDGGQKIDRYGNVTPRRYYECTNEQAYRALGPTNGVSRLDAVCYTNHAFGGRTGSLRVHGAIVSRDEAIIFSGNVQMNWDIRLGSTSEDAINIDIYLPRVLADPRTSYWREF